MKRILTAVICAALAVATTGCGRKNAEKPEEKQEIVVVCSSDINDTVKGIMRRFTNSSGTTRVRLVELSNESADVYWKTASMLADKKYDIDAMICEDVWVQGFIKDGYLERLCSESEFPADVFPKGIEPFVGNGGNVYWYPLILDTGVMYYRSDKTEPVASVDLIKKGLPYAVQGTDGEEMLCCALEYINFADSAEDGLRLYKENLNGSVGSDGEDYITEFTSGNAVYMRAWTSDYSKIESRLSVPGARLEAKLLTDDGGEYSVARAYGYSINANTDKKDSCTELLEYLKSDDVQLDILRGKRTLPIRRGDYKNPLVLDLNSYNAAAEKDFDSHVFRPARADYAYVSREVRHTLAKYLKGEETLEKAAAVMEELVNNTK